MSQGAAWQNWPSPAVDVDMNTADDEPSLGSSGAATTLITRNGRRAVARTIAKATIPTNYLPFAAPTSSMKAMTTRKANAATAHRAWAGPSASIGVEDDSAGRQTNRELDADFEPDADTEVTSEPGTRVNQRVWCLKGVEAMRSPATMIESH